MPNRILRPAPTLAVLALCGLAAGCGGDRAAAPEPMLAQTDADDLAAQVGASLAADNGGTLAAMPAAGTPGGITGKSAPAETTFTTGGITWTFTRTFYDDAGAVLPGYDPLLSVRVVSTSRAAGGIETDRYSASLGHAGELDVAGVAAWQDSLTINGAQNDTLRSDFTSLDGLRERHFDLLSSGSLVDVIYAKPAATGAWPLSGTATFTLVANRWRTNERAELEAHLEATVVVRFNGTRFADVDVSGGWTYRLDLKTGAVARV